MTRKPASSPDRIYVITGRLLRPYTEPGYSTDPRAYGVYLKPGVSDKEYSQISSGVKAFIERKDAIDFAYHCNLAGAMCPVFDRVGEGWKFNEVETERLAEDID